MRAFRQGDCLRVTVDRWDLAEFCDRWPCSGLRDVTRASFTFEANGDLVDVTCNGGDSERYDGPALAALSEDAQEYGARRTGMARQVRP